MVGNGYETKQKQMKHELPDKKQLITKFNESFKGLSPDTLNTLFSNEVVHFFKRGSLIYAEGDFARGCYFVYSGILKIFKTGTEGKGQIIRFSKSGDLIGFRSVLSQERLCTSAKVIDDAIVCFISANNLTTLIRENSDFALQMMKITCAELGDANNYITDIAQKTVRERLAEVLLHLESTFGLDKNGVLQITLTRAELANMVGTATESVIRMLSEFKSDKYIELNGRKIKLLQIDKLQKLQRNF